MYATESIFCLKNTVWPRCMWHCQWCIYGRLRSMLSVDLLPWNVHNNILIGNQSSVTDHNGNRLRSLPQLARLKMSSVFVNVSLSGLLLWPNRLVFHVHFFFRFLNSVIGLQLSIANMLPIFKMIELVAITLSWEMKSSVVEKCFIKESMDFCLKE